MPFDFVAADRRRPFGLPIWPRTPGSRRIWELDRPFQATTGLECLLRTTSILHYTGTPGNRLGTNM